MPTSPCKASTLLSTTLVEPVLVSVAEIFWPTLPDLPMPTTMILPRRFTASTIISTARSNDVVELRAHGFERGEFDVEDFTGLDEMRHRGEDAGKPRSFQSLNGRPAAPETVLFRLRKEHEHARAPGGHNGKLLLLRAGRNGQAIAMLSSTGLPSASSM